ncbi:hypothetical protein HG530_014412 [Fusarium avenaceum]|nr:hypothetical protein HG530_014412 [Fusarium avenaceum]
MAVIVISFLRTDICKRLIALVSVDAEVVLLHNSINVLNKLSLHLIKTILGRNAVINAQGDNLRHGVDLLAASDDVHGLCCLNNKLGIWIQPDDLGGQLFEIVLLEEVIELGVSIWGVPCQAHEMVVYRTSLENCRCVRLCFQSGYNFSHDADSCVRMRDRAVAALDTKFSPNINCTLFLHRGQHIEGIVNKLDSRTALIQNKRNTTITIPLCQKLSDLGSATMSRALLIEPERQNQGTLRRPLCLSEQRLNRRQQGRKTVLVIR